MFVGEISVFNFLVLFSLYCFIKLKPVICSSGHVVSIHYKTEYFCTGSIVKPHVILTSAHCFTDYHRYYTKLDDVKVYAGSKSRLISQDAKVDDTHLTPHADTDGKAKPYCVENLIIHPGFKFRERHADLALLILNKTIGELPPNPLGSVMPEVGTKCSLIGWSRLFPHGPLSMEIHNFDLIVEDPEICSVYMFYSSDFICLAPVLSMGDQGDRGGLLMCDGEQIGIGLFRFLKDYHHYVTNVPYYRDWILENSAIKQQTEFLLIFLTVTIAIVL